MQHLYNKILIYDVLSDKKRIRQLCASYSFNYKSKNKFY
jgi:hypothetical protein